MSLVSMLKINLIKKLATYIRKWMQNQFILLKILQNGFRGRFFKSVYYTLLIFVSLFTQCSLMRNFRWSAKLCFEKNYYLCQHRMPYVSEKNRQRVYARWNETFPGQKANEIQVYVKPGRSDAGNRRWIKIFTHDFSKTPLILFLLLFNVHFRINRELNREANVISKRPTSSPQRASHRSRDQSDRNQIPVNRRRLSNEINPPEVLSTQDTQLRRKKQHNKSKEREALKLSGNVDLGLKKKSLRTRTKTTSTTSTTTTEHPNEIPRNFHPQPPPQPSSNHHRHNHYNTDYDRNDYRRTMMTSTTTQYPITYQAITTSHTSSSHQQSPINPSITSPPTSGISSKQIEKVNDFVFNASYENFIHFLHTHTEKTFGRHP